MFNSFEFLENIRKSLYSEIEKQGAIFLTLKSANDKLLNGINNAEEMLDTQAWTVSSFLQNRRKMFENYGTIPHLQNRTHSPYTINKTFTPGDLNETSLVQEPCSRMSCALDKRLLKLETRMDCLTRLDRVCCAHEKLNCSESSSAVQTPRRPRQCVLSRPVDDVAVQTPRSMMTGVEGSQQKKTKSSGPFQPPCSSNTVSGYSGHLVAPTMEKLNKKNKQKESSEPSETSRTRTVSNCSSTESIHTLVEGDYRGYDKENSNSTAVNFGTERPPRCVNSTSNTDSFSARRSRQRRPIPSVSVPPISGLSSLSSPGRPLRVRKQNSLESSYETIYDGVLKNKNDSARSHNPYEVVRHPTIAKVCDYL